MTQMTIFDVMYPERFCENESINILVEVIERRMNAILPQLPKLKSSKKEYSVWDNVPRFGKRLAMDYFFEKIESTIVSETSTYYGLGIKKVEDLIDYDSLSILAESMGIEFDISFTPWSIHMHTTERKKK